MDSDDFRVIEHKLGKARIARLAEQLTTGLGANSNTTEIVESIGRALDVNEYRRGSGVCKERPPETPVDGPVQPASYLTSWREILVALGFKNNREDKQKVSRLNKGYSGPIEIPGQGKQPFVDKTKLLDWWAGLEVKVREEQQRKQDTQAIVVNRHDFGRGGEVSPDISGGIKKRRRDRKP